METEEKPRQVHDTNSQKGSFYRFADYIIQGEQAGKASQKGRFSRFIKQAEAELKIQIIDIDY
jgi:hypothetical protein